ncbi:TIGR01459 family HAD-type hydrolase [Candidatus Pelagibacter bacterium]|nr:TIGR01459 family HAD-type hydrolase [Candidatus Pelagibacter bacterium]
MRNLNHLSEIFNSYDTYVVDLWGVMHNGISLNPKAIEVIENLSKNSKKVVFLSNAPRPSANVIDFLKKMKMDEKFLSKVVTSGEAAMQAVNSNKFGKKFYHLGPVRDNSIFRKVESNKTTLEKCDFILCTGFFDEEENDLNYYKSLLKNSTKKKLVCTNPDLVVHRGNVEELCAGSIAKVFESIGGKVIYYGKPYREIYEMCFNKGEKVLAIGDNLRTDIKGANNLNIDNLFIYSGVHRNEINIDKDISELLIKYDVKINYFQKELKW